MPANALAWSRIWTRSPRSIATVWARFAATSNASLMRVVIVNYVLTVMRGGGETRDLSWARELRRLGVDVSFLSIRPLFRAMRYPLEPAQGTTVRAPYLRNQVYRLMDRRVVGRLASVLLDVETRVFCAR